MRHLCKILFSSIAALVIAGPLAAETGAELRQRFSGEETSSDYAPIDNCTDAGRRNFYHRLSDVVASRDMAGLVAMAHPESITLNQEGAPPSAIAAMVAPSRANLFWETLGRAISLGCDIHPTNDNPALVIPGTLNRTIMSPGFNKEALTLGNDVWMLNGTEGSGASRIATLDWELVTLTDGWNPDLDMQPVQTSDGREGYIATSDLYLTMGLRIIARREEGGWVISALAVW